MDLTPPLFKPSKVLEASMQLGEGVRTFLREYDAIMASPPTFKRGAETAEALNKLQKSFVFWGIETNQQIRAGNVDKVIKDHESHNP